MCELLFYRRAWLIAFIWETERLTCSETGEWAWLTAQSPTSGVYHICFSGNHTQNIVSRCIMSTYSGPAEANSDWSGESLGLTS